ncbi:hypothetical protein C9980_20290 [Vibrio mediterranei]|nr:hypothetical protein C9980_20290 [Vibrio mediterranei]
MKTIYFNIRPASRDRMWDTIKAANNLFDTSTPNGVIQSKSVRKFKPSSFSINAFAKKQLSKLLVNNQNYDQNSANGAEFYYFWGAFPKQKTTTPYVVELDNPYSLCYYEKSNFERNKSKIASKIQSCKAVTFMSETCRNHSFELYGKENFPNSHVVYPFVEDNLSKHQPQSEVTNLLFVGIDFRRKGGPELLEAFFNTKDTRLRLTVVSDISETMKAPYASDSRITFLPLTDRDTLLSTVFPTMDVMVLPSFHESFGMVLLEAMSFGMALIAVDAYATKEIVVDNYNGFLLSHPIIRPELHAGEEVVNCVELTINEFSERYLENNEFYYGLYSDLRSCFEKIADEKESFKSNSAKLFNDKFSPSCWENRFKVVFE